MVKMRSPLKIIMKEKGFALVAAILANLLLLIFGIIALNLSTQDLRISTKSVGEKKAFSAAESGIHVLTTTLDPSNLASAAVSDVAYNTEEPSNRYSIGTPGLPVSGPAMLPMAGFSIGGGQVWGQTRYDISVTGENINYNARVRIQVGMGYGPIEMTTMSR
jgi:Tfp pilus assembly protein PilX